MTSTFHVRPTEGYKFSFYQVTGVGSQESKEARKVGKMGNFMGGGFKSLIDLLVT